MSQSLPPWPRVAGVSLLLFPIGHREEEWAQAETVVRNAVEGMDVAVARGLSQCPPNVSEGARGLAGPSGDDVLIFACPADIGLFEAAPLAAANETGTMLSEVGTFFREASEAALTLAPCVAWVVAHEWLPRARVRWASGDVDSLVLFATSPGAWRTDFLIKPGRILESDDWPFWFEVTGPAGQPARRPYDRPKKRSKAQ